MCSRTASQVLMQNTSTLNGIPPATAGRTRCSFSRTLLEWHRSLIELRNSLPELTDGVLDKTLVSFDEGEEWLVMTRSRVTVACNFSAGARRIEGKGIVEQNVLLASEEPFFSEEGVALPPRSVFIAPIGRESKDHIEQNGIKG